MMNYRITYSIDVDDDEHAGSFTVENTGLSDSAEHHE